VKLLKGLGYGLDEAAQGAIMKFEFEAAKIGSAPVPVWLRYTYKFVLEK
jgi:protein TonB